MRFYLGVFPRIFHRAAFGALFRYRDRIELCVRDVAPKFSPDIHGVWWFNRRRRTEKQVSEVTPDGRRRYVRRSTTIQKPKEEWVAIPVPDAGIPREWVDRAREVIGGNAKFSRASGRFWELSGLMKCSRCNGGMLGNSPTNGSRKKVHHYYCCRTRHLEGTGACSMSKNIRADEAERAVWSFVTSLLLNPDTLREGLDEMVNRERVGNRSNPEDEAAVWLDRLAEADRRRQLSRYGRRGPHHLRRTWSQIGGP